MTGTALGAKEKTTRTITFKNKEHENFYQEYLPKCRYEDVYHKALVYCLGIDRDTREHINRIYDFKSGCVKTECLHEGWQTSGSVRIVRIPKVLFTDDYFRNLSSDAKVLYGLMLDRMALSMKNRWIDEENRVYIIFSLEQVMMYMNCGRDKGMKTLAELDTKKGIGLIERVKQGFGKPDVIYVKSFLMKEKPEPVPEPEAFETEGEGLSSDEVGNADLSRSEKPTCRGRKNRPDEVDKTDLSRSEKPTYRGRESRSPEVGKIDPNYTYYNNTDLSDTDRSNTNLINPSERQPAKRSGRMDEMDVIHAYTAIVKENIEYDTLIQSARLGEKEYIDEIVELLVETISAKRDTLSIGGAEYPYQFVKNKLLKVESSHIQYLLECLHDNTTKIHNVRAYLLACIFNAPSTINNYYRAEVNHDMYGGGNL